MPTTPAKPTINGDAIRVLVIDDDARHAETVAESLERVGYDCTVATSGTEGARLIREQDWDVVLTDLKMNDLDGLAILKRAREELPDAEVHRRVLARRLCSRCGLDYNLMASRPAVAETCDVCGGELVSRPDDTPEALIAGALRAARR